MLLQNTPPRSYDIEDWLQAEDGHQMFHKAWNGSDWLPSQTDWEFLGGVFDSRLSIFIGYRQLLYEAIDLSQFGH